MLDALFSVSGRMDRAQFVRWSLFQGVVSLLLLTGLNGLSADAVASLQTGGIDAAIPRVVLVLLLGLLLVLLPSSALIVKRLRDVGLPAWPSFGVIAAIDALLAGVVPHGAGLMEGPFAGLAFTTLVIVVLAFVPGRGGETGEASEQPMSAWVERAIEVEGKLIADRRHPTVPTSAARALDQLESLEALRRQGAAAPDSAPGQTFGRRRGDRR